MYDRSYQLQSSVRTKLAAEGAERPLPDTNRQGLADGGSSITDLRLL